MQLIKLITRFKEQKRALKYIIILIKNIILLTFYKAQNISFKKHIFNFIIIFIIFKSRLKNIFKSLKNLIFYIKIKNNFNKLLKRVKLYY